MTVPGAGPGPGGFGPAAAAAAVVAAVEGGAMVVAATRLTDPPGRVLFLQAPGAPVRREGSLGREVDDALLPRARELLQGRGEEGRVEAGGVPVYLELHRPRPELVIVGAGHIAQPLSRVGALLGFRVVVADDRPDFATRERFPDAERVVRVDFSRAFEEIPLGPGSHVVLVTRGHKYDYECLRQLLREEVDPRYIGMIGSRRRVRATFQQLLDEGVSRTRIARVRAPVGLDVGAETPAEIAVAVAGEMILEWRGGTGTPLHRTERVLERFFKDERTPEARS